MWCCDVIRHHCYASKLCHNAETSPHVAVISHHHTVIVEYHTLTWYYTLWRHNTTLWRSAMTLSVKNQYQDTWWMRLTFEIKKCSINQFRLKVLQHQQKSTGGLFNRIFLITWLLSANMIISIYLSKACLDNFTTSPLWIPSSFTANVMYRSIGATRAHI